jgi:hypothetical protein
VSSEADPPQGAPHGRWSRLASPPILLLLGLLGIVAVTVSGRSDLFTTVLSPPMPARLLLGIAAFIVALLVVLAAADRMRTDKDPRGLIRAIRLMFVAVGLFAVAVGWFIGSPVPVVAGIVITAIDLLETSFLLLVTQARSASGSQPTDRDGSETP